MALRENRLARGCFPALGRSARLSNIKAPMLVLAAAEDEIVALPQALAAKSLCRATSVAVRVEPGRHLSVFLGQRTLGGGWREIARWLKGGRRRDIAKRAGSPIVAALRRRRGVGTREAVRSCLAKARPASPAPPTGSERLKVGTGAVFDAELCSSNRFADSPGSANGLSRSIAISSSNAAHDRFGEAHARARPI
jgi:hypothetical protein